MTIYTVSVAVEYEPHTKKVEVIHIEAANKQDAKQKTQTKFVQYPRIKILNIVAEPTY